MTSKEMTPSEIFVAKVVQEAAGIEQGGDKTPEDTLRFVLSTAIEQTKTRSFEELATQANFTWLISNRIDPESVI